MQLRWTPDNGQAGDYELRFRAVDTADPDNVLVSEIVVPVTVFNQNRRPVVQAIENVAIARGEVLEIPLRATDQDGNPLILGLMNESPFRPLPDFISLTDHGDGTGTIRIAQMGRASCRERGCQSVWI